MKRLLSFLIGMFVSVTVFAERMDEGVVKFSNISTGDTESVSSSPVKYNGYAERVSVLFRTNTVTVAIRVSSSNEYSGLTQTIYENTNGVATNFTIYPRITADTTSGSDISTEYIRIPLVNDNIIYEVWDASATNQDVTILFYYNGI